MACPPCAGAAWKLPEAMSWSKSGTCRIQASSLPQGSDLPSAGRMNANLKRPLVPGSAAGGKGQRSPSSMASSTQGEGAEFRHWSHLQHVGGGVVRRLRRCQRRGQLAGGQQLLRQRQRQRRRGARRLLPARVPPVRRALQIREDTNHWCDIDVRGDSVSARRNVSSGAPPINGFFPCRDSEHLTMEASGCVSASCRGPCSDARESAGPRLSARGSQCPTDLRVAERAVAAVAGFVHVEPRRLVD